MRVLVFLVFVGLFLGWQLMPGADPATPALTPASVSQTRSDMEILHRAQAAGLLVEDQHRHELRQAAIEAGHSLENAPCDAPRQEQLRRALDALLGHLRDTMDKPLETVTVDGRVIDASPALNEAARQVWQNAAAAGIMRDDALADARSGAPGARPMQSTGSGPYACRVG